MLKTEQIRIQRKILGALIRNARERAGLDIDETASLLELDVSTLKDYESGHKEASLPELEAIAHIFDIPFDYFWSDTPFPEPQKSLQIRNMIVTRRIEIGQLLSQARGKMGKTEQQISDLLNCSPNRVIDYELGRLDIPLSELQRLASFLDVPFDYFLKEELKSAPSEVVQPSTPTSARSVVRPQAGLEHLSEDVITFLQDPANVLYVKLSMRLEGLSATNLRTLAEGILDITY